MPARTGASSSGIAFVEVSAVDASRPASGVAFAFATQWPALIWVCAALWGAMGGALYTLSMIRVAHDFADSSALAGTSAMIAGYTVGGSVGPLVSGWAFDHVGVVGQGDEHGGLETEALAGDAAGLAAAERTLDALARRRAQAGGARRDVVSIVSLPGLAAMLRDGLVGRDGLPAATLAERRAWAAEEVSRIARLCADPPLGVTIGVLEHAPPSQTFQILSGPAGAVAAASPFRLGGRPNVTLGVATITADPAAVALYERLAERLWRESLKGEAAAKRLAALLG